MQADRPSLPAEFDREREAFLARKQMVEWARSCYQAQQDALTNLLAAVGRAPAEAELSAEYVGGEESLANEVGHPTPASTGLSRPLTGRGGTLASRRDLRIDRRPCTGGRGTKRPLL